LCTPSAILVLATPHSRLVIDTFADPPVAPFVASTVHGAFCHFGCFFSFDLRRRSYSRNILFSPPFFLLNLSPFVRLCVFCHVCFFSPATGYLFFFFFLHIVLGRRVWRRVARPLLGFLSLVICPDELLFHRFSHPEFFLLAIFPSPGPRRLKFFFFEFLGYPMFFSFMNQLLSPPLEESVPPAALDCSPGGLSSPSFSQQPSFIDPGRYSSPKALPSFFSLAWALPPFGIGFRGGRICEDQAFFFARTPQHLVTCFWMGLFPLPSSFFLVPRSPLVFKMARSLNFPSQGEFKARALCPLVCFLFFCYASGVYCDSFPPPFYVNVPGFRSLYPTSPGVTKCGLAISFTSFS